jgi:hypothetical protein
MSAVRRVGQALRENWRSGQGWDRDDELRNSSDRRSAGDAWRVDCGGRPQADPRRDANDPRRAVLRATSMEPPAAATHSIRRSERSRPAARRCRALFGWPFPPRRRRRKKKEKIRRRISPPVTSHLSLRNLLFFEFIRDIRCSRLRCRQASKRCPPQRSRRRIPTCCRVRPLLCR